MTNEIKKLLKAFKLKFPNVVNLSVQFEGSGDSFSDFWDLECTVKEGTPEVKINGHELILKEKFDKDSSWEREEKAVNDLFFKIMDLNTSVDFNNEGCRGTITIDFIKGLINLNVEIPEVNWINASDEPYGFDASMFTIKKEKTLADFKKKKAE